MADVVLSQSLIQNTEDSQMNRDPFQQARNQYASRKDQPQSVLSSTPFSANPAANVSQPLEDYKPLLQKLGINPNGIQMTETGKMQLLGRLREKFGEGMKDNKDALSALDLFNKHLTSNVDSARNMMNQSLANANRTLSALFGGKGV